MTGRLHDKVALVTGGARGIGEAVVAAFVAEGARAVYVTDLDGDGAVRVAGALGDRARGVRLDVRAEADWERVLADVVRVHGGLDVLVNNAGITGFEQGPVAHDPENASLNEWRAVFATNCDGVFLGCKHGVRAMRAHGRGSIVNLSSRSGMVGIPAAAAYAASKAAVRNHTKTVALWCAQQGLAIRCNSVHPAAILTSMWDGLLGSGPKRAEREREFVRETPLQRFGTPAEVAALIVHLASDESAYTTGAEFTIDGGLLAGSGGVPRGRERG